MGCARPKRELGFLRSLFLHTFLYMLGSLGDESSLESALYVRAHTKLEGEWPVGKRRGRRKRSMRRRARQPK
jgi:hypothetical protein